MRNADSIAAVWFTVFNGAAFVAFGFDKWRATRSEWRLSEASLVWLGALGGWPGGLLGMHVFRHKVSKLSFKLKYGLGLIPFAAVIGAWLYWR